MFRYVFLQFLYPNINNLFSYLSMNSYKTTTIEYVVARKAMYSWNKDMYIIYNIMHEKQTNMVSCNLKNY